MPPTNDNWANAINLGSETSGYTTGNNFNATSQVGEPALPDNTAAQKTVWYKWTSPLTAPNNPGTTTDTYNAPSDVPWGTIFFSTVFNNGHSEVANPLRTIVQVFTGNAVNALTEMIYSSEDNWNQNYANWDFGSKVVFNTPSAAVNNPATIYYIRVDGVGGAQGNFPLTWGQYYRFNLARCDGCPPGNLDDSVCVATVVQDVTLGSHSNSFGSVSSGNYRVKFCQGAAFEQSFGVWFVPTGQGGAANTSVTYNGGANTAALNIAPGIAYGSLAEAETGNRCLSANFYHTTGSITLDSFDDFLDIPSEFPPVFGLYKVVKPTLVFYQACAQWNVVGTSASLIFTIQNTSSSLLWKNVTATLSAAAGISSPSAPVTHDFAAPSIVNYAFTFNCSTYNVTATVTLTSPDFPNPLVFTVFLGPIITLDPAIGDGGIVFCTPTRHGFFPSLKNSGWWQIAGTATMSVSGGLTFTNCANPSCGTIGSPHVTSPTVTCATHSAPGNDFGVSGSFCLVRGQTGILSVSFADTFQTFATAAYSLTVS